MMENFWSWAKQKQKIETKIACADDGEFFELGQKNTEKLKQKLLVQMMEGIKRGILRGFLELDEKLRKIPEVITFFYK